jgi:hypothetical protein
MPDKRELILSRLFEVLQEVDGVVTAVRNRGLLKNERLPAVVLLDGDESSVRAGEGRGRVSMSPATVRMRPQIFFLLEVRTPQNVNVGQDLNAKRVEIIRRVAQDDELRQLVGSNGDITYFGCVTDLKSGNSVQGELQIDIAFTYHLDPYNLT